MVEPLTRVEIESAWKIISFVLNSLLFLLVGLQMREIVNAVSTPAGYVAIVAVVIVAAVVGIRLLWSLAVPAAWRGARGLAGREVGPATSRGWRFALGWSGPRGAVALAAALSLPVTVHGGGPTPGRDLVIVLTLIVIVATLGGQGLTLRPIIRRLGLTDPDGVDREEARAKHVAAEAALGRLDEAADRHDLDDEQRDWLEREYAVRSHRFGGGATEDEMSSLEGEELTDLELLDEARSAVLALESRGEIRSEVAQQVLRDLDLDSARLQG
jgi:CPA1 family monovalent cation:H+ antiporter